MVNSHGYRNRTRDVFSKKFRKSGPIALSRYMETYKLGDVVDIKGDGSIQKGMPHRYYHGRTGTVWNVTPHAVGVVVNKKVGHRIIAKRIHVRIEHVKKSTCNEAFKQRVRRNEEIKKIARENNEPVILKRVPVLPREGAIVKTKKVVVERMSAVPYEFII